MHKNKTADEVSLFFSETKNEKRMHQINLFTLLDFKTSFYRLKGLRFMKRLKCDKISFC